ncbi:hypothetical protein EDD15DRAFT_2201269 [Pisolithus albus]|nr:hypothetical protein EDD15DRAFT_2201269 [Pisolithus albus]
MPDIMVRLFLVFFGYATCSLLHITLPQVSWLSTGSTTPEIFMDTNSAPHFSYGYEPRRVPGPLFRYLRTSVPQFDMSANYFVFDVSTVLRAPSSDSSLTCRRTTLSSTCPRYYVPLPLTQVRRAEELLRVQRVHHCRAPFDYVNLARVTLHATSRPFQVRRVFDVSTLLRAPSSDYVSLTGVPLDATSRAPSKSDVSTTVEPPSSDYVGLTGIPLDATLW